MQLLCSSLMAERLRMPRGCSSNTVTRQEAAFNIIVALLVQASSNRETLDNFAGRPGSSPINHSVRKAVQVFAPRFRAVEDAGAHQPI
jgi:hypothetical protein